MSNKLYNILLSLILFFATISTSFAAVTDKKDAAAKDNIRIFASYEPTHDEIIVNDSMLVNVVVYSSVPFRHIEMLSKNIKAKGGRMRLLPNHELQQQRVRMEDGVYYAVVFQRYIVGSDNTGTISLPDLQIESEVIVYDTEELQPFSFDPFGFFRQTPRKGRSIKQKCKVENLRINVTEKPKRSTQEAMRSGARVI